MERHLLNVDRDIDPAEERASYFCFPARGKRGS